MRRPKDVMCGKDLNGLHSLSPPHGTEHVSDLISLIITTALWDGGHDETTILWRRKRRLQEDEDLTNLRRARAW